MAEMRYNPFASHLGKSGLGALVDDKVLLRSLAVVLITAAIVSFILGVYAFGFWAQWTIMVHGFHWTARIVGFVLKLEGSTLAVIMLTWVFVTFRDTSGDILEWVRHG